MDYKTPNGGSNPIVRCLLFYESVVIRVGNNRIDPKKQFSKKLATWTSVFWFLYMPWLSAIILINPQSAVFAVYMAIITTGVMIINVVSYTRNSIMEKMALTLLDKTKIELQLNGKSTTSEPDNASEDVPEEDGEEDG